MIYNRTKEDIAPCKLIKEIKLLSFANNIVSVTISGSLISVETSEALTIQEQSELDVAVDNHNSTDTAQTIQNSIDRATEFGYKLMREFVVENVMMGITQAGKTGAVADYLQKLDYYINVASLYEAVSHIDDLIGAGVPAELDPFVTEARLLAYKTKIQQYLS